MKNIVFLMQDYFQTGMIIKLLLLKNAISIILLITKYPYL